MTEKPERKQPGKVLSIKGDYAPDVITQAQLLEASEFQATVWIAERLAREKVQAIEARIKQGAAIEDGPLHFDAELQMVRTRKKEGAG